MDDDCNIDEDDEIEGLFFQFSKICFSFVFF